MVTKKILFGRKELKTGRGDKIISFESGLSIVKTKEIIIAQMKNNSSFFFCLKIEIIKKTKGITPINIIDSL